tara:strand:- start:7068 stop:7778 length:711 start_codon:yes stop_codon:yes gene_type:complete
MNRKNSSEIQLEQSWLKELNLEFQKDYMQNLKSFLLSEKREGKKIYPKGKEIFRALDITPLNKVKVVIIGQDPYHGPGQAHGLCFSVPKGVKIPPSLINIFKELQEDLGITPSANGCLLPWAKQGVLLLNSILSVERGISGSHSLKGWERFTDAIISEVNKKKSVVFMLWGKYATQKGKSIDTSKHLVLKSAHPSPLSAHHGFFGNKHFSQCNLFLQERKISPINWALPKKEIPFG